MEARYLLQNNATIRETAKAFNLGKSTIYHDLSKRLSLIDFNLYEEVKRILANHLTIRHLKGGEATKKKHQALRR